MTSEPAPALVTRAPPGGGSGTVYPVDTATADPSAATAKSAIPFGVANAAYPFAPYAASADPASVRWRAENCSSEPVVDRSTTPTTGVPSARSPTHGPSGK